MGGCHQNGNIGDTSVPFTQRSTITQKQLQKQKQLRELWRPPKKFQQQSGTQSLKIITLKKMKTASFCQYLVPPPLPPGWHCSMPRETFQLGRITLTRRGRSGVNPPLQPSMHPQRSCCTPQPPYPTPPWNQWSWNGQRLGIEKGRKAVNQLLVLLTFVLFS